MDGFARWKPCGVGTEPCGRRSAVMARGWVAGAVALALVGGACGRDARKDAAPDVSALLAAASKGDQRAFEAGLDRSALRADVKSQLLTLPEIRALQSQLGEEVGDVAADKMVSPLSVGQARTGLPPAATARDVARALKVLDRDRVCLRDSEELDACALTFQKQAQGWKLIALRVTDLRAQIPEIS